MHCAHFGPLGFHGNWAHDHDLVVLARLRDKGARVRLARTEGGQIQSNWELGKDAQHAFNVHALFRIQLNRQWCCLDGVVSGRGGGGLVHSISDLLGDCNVVHPIQVVSFEIQEYCFIIWYKKWNSLAKSTHGQARAMRRGRARDD